MGMDTTFFACTPTTGTASRLFLFDLLFGFFYTTTPPKPCFNFLGRQHTPVGSLSLRYPCALALLVGPWAFLNPRSSLFSRLAQNGLFFFLQVDAVPLFTHDHPFRLTVWPLRYLYQKKWLDKINRFFSFANTTRFGVYVLLFFLIGG